MEYNAAKFKALVQYVCFKCTDPVKLGAVKLNKVLWLADTLAYLNWGKPISGETYIKRQRGPVPKHIVGVLKDLEKSGALAIREPEEGTFKPRMFFALKAPEISAFSPQEISLIEDTLRYVRDKHTARSISEASHNAIWELAEIGEEIPYYTVFASKLGELDETDVGWARGEWAKIRDAAKPKEVEPA